MLLYALQFGSKTFHGESTKDAYMKAVKWYATKVISQNKMHGVSVEYIKSADEPKVTVVLYAMLPENEIRERHCKICKEMHNAFFINEATECSRCTAMGYQKRLDQQIGVKASYYKELLQRATKGEQSNEDA